MFEIGNTLREARLRAGLDLQECAERTKIRGKYLRALESEEFDVLPSPTYVRGFLRSYAEFLGLDWQLVLDEHESRFGRIDPLTGEMAGPARRPRPGGGPGRRRGAASASARKGRSETQMLWFAVGGVLGVALIIWLGVGDPSEPDVAIPDPAKAGLTAAAGREPAPAAAGVADQPAAGVERPAAAAAADTTEAPQQLVITLTGVGERGSWVEVRARGPNGRAVFADVLGDGESRRFTVSRSLWVRAGYAEGLSISVNGEAQEISGGVADFLISGRGVERL